MEKRTPEGFYLHPEKIEHVVFSFFILNLQVNHPVYLVVHSLSNEFEDEIIAMNVSTDDGGSIAIALCNFEDKEEMVSLQLMIDKQLVGTLTKFRFEFPFAPY